MLTCVYPRRLGRCMLLMTTAPLLLSKSLIQTSQIQTTTANQLAGPTLSTTTWIMESYLSSVFSPYLFTPFWIPFSPISSLDAMAYHFNNDIAIFTSSLFLYPFTTSIWQKKKISLFLYEVIYLPHLCFKPGNWMLLEQTTQVTRWYHYKVKAMCFNSALNTVQQF